MFLIHPRKFLTNLIQFTQVQGESMSEIYYPSLKLHYIYCARLKNGVKFFVAHYVQIRDEVMPKTTYQDLWPLNHFALQILTQHSAQHITCLFLPKNLCMFHFKFSLVDVLFNASRTGLKQLENLTYIFILQMFIICIEYMFLKNLD